MTIHTGVTTSAPELVLVVICHMNLCFWIPVLPRKAKVNDVYHISKPAGSHQEIIRQRQYKSMVQRSTGQSMDPSVEPSQKSRIKS
jgi:hypothetical protein